MFRNILIVLVLLWPSPASGDEPVPPTRLGTDAVITTSGGSTLNVPPGTIVVLPETWEKINAELLRLQEQETRLVAENTSLKKSARESGALWGTVAVLVSGVLAGLAIERYVLDN